MEIIFLFAAIAFGLIIGSFLNCLIWRLYKNESLGGRSYCPACRQAIAWYDNIPLLSFFLLGGSCRHCRKKISWQYPLVELAAALLFGLIWLLHRPGLELAVTASSSAPLFAFLRDLVIASSLIVIFVYDLRWQLVPMLFVWPVSALILILNMLAGTPWPAELLFALIGGAFFLIQFILTKKKGVGEGDIWLGVLLGLAFPRVDMLFLIMVVSYGLGAVVGLVLMGRGQKSWKSALPLGPFLALGALSALLWGERIISWYLALLR